MPNKRLPMLSVVVPCYNEEDAIPIFLGEITKVLSDMKSVDYELVFVDDGSHDATLSILRKLSKGYSRVRYVSFSRNFGKEAAMLAGLETAVGDYVAVMDIDLQDPPDLLPEMYDAIVNEGFDCAAARRDTRKCEPPIRSFFAGKFYRLINKISDTEIVDGARDYRLMTRQVVDAVLSLKEYNRFSKGIFGWVGFKTKWLSYDNLPRAAGNAKWNFWKLFLYAIDGIIGFSTVPLAIASISGILFCILSFFGIIFIVARWLLFGDPVAGWASTVCIVLFASGVQLFCVGILGQYLAKNYMESKQRPIYIIQESSQSEDCNYCITEEELAKIEALEAPIMEQAIEGYRGITTASEFQEMEQLRSKARHDEAQALHHARLEEREKWQGVIADKDMLIAELRARLGEDE